MHTLPPRALIRSVFVHFQHTAAATAPARRIGSASAYLADYVVAGFALEPAAIEAVMLTMNSVNACPYCTGLHGQLARTAGADDNPGPVGPEVACATTFAHASAGRRGRRRCTRPGMWGGVDYDDAHGRSR